MRPFSRLILPFWLGAIVLLPACPAATGTVKPAENGIVIDGGGELRFELEYPQMAGAGEHESFPIIEKTAKGDTAVVRYAGGARADLRVAPDNTVTVRFSDCGDRVKSFSFATRISFYFINGGQWKFDADHLAPFPAVKPPKPFLFDKNAGSFTVFTGDGRGVEFTMPPFSYNQLADNRAWDWKVFLWKFFVPFNHDHPEAILKIAFVEDAAIRAANPVVQVDALGQNARSDWPDKMKGAEELASDIAADETYYASFHPPEFDRYGGLPGSGRKWNLKKSGFFHVEQKDGKWFLVDPDGNVFFHLGLCCFSPLNHTFVGGRREIFEWLPAYEGEFQSAFLSPQEPESISFHAANLIRKYGHPIDKAEWSLRMIRRVRQWGFNSAGAFTDPPDLGLWSQIGFPYVLALPTNTWEGFREIPGLPRMADPFDESLRAPFDAMCAARIPPRANDPALIGYFLVNEPPYQDIPRVVSALKGSEYPCKRKLVEMLRQKYGDIGAFNAAWGMSAGSFEDLLDQGLPKTTAAATADLAQYSDAFLEAYFQWMVSTFRKYDTNHLLLGNRLTPETINNESLCRIMGRYVDVVSFNYYTDYLDPDLLAKIHKWTGNRPLMLSEFQWTSPSDSGLPSGVKDVGSQAERGLAYRYYVETAASLGFIVGAEWFTLVDQPVSGAWWGRYDGENGNTGLFSVVDRPWKKTVEPMAKTNFEIYDVLFGLRAPFAFDNPSFQPKPSKSP